MSNWHDPDNDHQEEQFGICLECGMECNVHSQQCGICIRQFHGCLLSNALISDARMSHKSQPTSLTQQDMTLELDKNQSCRKFRKRRWQSQTKDVQRCETSKKTH